MGRTAGSVIILYISWTCHSRTKPVRLCSFPSLQQPTPLSFPVVQIFSVFIRLCRLPCPLAQLLLAIRNRALFATQHTPHCTAIPSLDLAGTMRRYLGLHGDALNWAIGMIAGCDFLLFGYDQGVMGGLLTLDSFLEAFPTINPNAGPPAESGLRSTYQGSVSRLSDLRYNSSVQNMGHFQLAPDRIATSAANMLS